MKKWYIFFIFMLLSINPSLADTMVVKAVSAISTDTPDEIVKVCVVKDCKLGNIELKEGYVLEGKMLNVTEPQRLKKDAVFTFYPLKYTNEKGRQKRIGKVYVGTYTPKFEIDAKKLAKSAVLTVGNHFVKGISTGYRAVEGAIQNKEDNRLKSAVENVYENSPLSYIEKGEQLHIEPETYFGLKFEDCKNSSKNSHTEINYEEIEQ